jgi:hypothetical protein
MGGSSGDTAVRMFKGVEVNPSERLAREAIQNSWDAANEFIRQDPEHQFRVTFRFRSLLGDEKQRIVESLSLRDLRDRAHSVSQQHERLMEGTCLRDLDDPKAPLRILEIEDRGAHGLFGHPNLKRKSHLYKALFTLGETGKDGSATSGGSFGFGKAAFIGASRISTVAAYTCFARQSSAPHANDEATRRFVAMAWWPSHEVGDEDLNGLAWIGSAHGAENLEYPNPAEDFEADEYATAMGLPTRSPDDLFDLGTTLVVVDPSVVPTEVLRGIERNWWPALLSGAFDAEVVDYDDRCLHPDPEADPLLQPYVRAFRIADNSSAKLNKDTESRQVLREIEVLGEHLKPGVLAQILPTEEAVHAENADEADHDPLIGADYPVFAFIREPRMIVKYHVFNKLKVKIAIRGVLLASSRFDPFLKQMEPPLHNEWTVDPDHDEPEILEAKSRFKHEVLPEIREAVRQFARDAQPPPPPITSTLPEFQKLIGPFIGRMPGAPTPVTQGNPLPVRISTSEQREVVGSSAVRLIGEYTILDDRPASAKEWMPLSVTIDVRILREDRIGDRIQKTLVVKRQDPGSDFRQEADGNVYGRTRPGSSATFSITTDPYDDRWEVRTDIVVQARNDNVQAEIEEA